MSVGFTVRVGRVEISDVRRMVYEPTPWEYPREHPAYARYSPYTLLIHNSGFMQRIYDWQGRPVRVDSGAP